MVECIFFGCMFMYVSGYVSLGFLGEASGKELTCQCRRNDRLGFDPWEDSLEEEMATHSSILALGIQMDRGAIVGYGGL